MRYSLLLKCFLLFICIESCNARNGDANTDAEFTDTSIVSKTITPDSFPAGKLMPGIICRTDAGQSYALYIPVKKDQVALPVIYFFDPHGDGVGALNRYIDLAERYGFMMVASNNSKNGNDWPTEEHIWSSLYNDIQTRLKVNSKLVYVCGFSGGAKAATYFALHNNNISGVIACGAALPEITQSGNFNFSFTAIAGEGDMNRSDLIAVNSSLNNTSNRHRIIFFDGIHAWPPNNIMDMAFAGLQFDAMAKKIIPADSIFINEYVTLSQKRITDLFNANKLERAEAACTLAINLLSGLTNSVNWFTEKQKAIKSNPAYQQQLAVSNKLQQREQEIKIIYQQQFQQGDMNYWVTTINDVMARAKASGTEAAMYQRLQAYLSLAFYSMSNQNINSRQDAAAKHFVILYTLVDESNSEAWYFSAILNARNKNVALVKADLLKAISHGFSDKARLMQQPDFQGIDLNEILSKLK